MANPTRAKNGMWRVPCRDLDGVVQYLHLKRVPERQAQAVQVSIGRCE
jgi:hypothetical protein